MIKSALIIVPHQDDELNIGGFILNRLLKQDAVINILYVTKGNFYKDKYSWRQKERDKILQMFGDIKYKQLEYDDGYDYKNHTFNNRELKTDIERDIYDYILKCRSDLIICVDFDAHADHRMVSALFDKAMEKILKEGHNYNPIVLKKFAYLGVWTGYNDYFNIQLMRTCENEHYENDRLYIETLPNAWEDRLCIKTETSDCSLKFWKSTVWKAYTTYWTQCGYKYFFNAANADIVYWFRNTNNLMMKAELSADSGNTDFINDFSIGNINLITEHFKSVEDKFPNSAWIPNDSKKELFIKWTEPVKIKTIKLYQNFRSLGHINSIQLVGMQGCYNEILECTESDVNYFHLQNEISTDSILFKIVDSRGNAGIRELEMYPDDGLFPWNDCPFEKYEDIKQVRSMRMKILTSKIENITWVVFRILNKIRKKIGLSYWGN